MNILIVEAQLITLNKTLYNVIPILFYVFLVSVMLKQ